MLNNKGYTLVELLATVIILGIVMAVIIPNISGISTQNKITTYAEDAKKFKNTVEYMLRGDDTVVKPKKNGECVIVNLKYVHGNEFDNPPYGGRYLMDQSFVVMTKSNRQLNFYVQLVEEYIADGMSNYKGFSLLNYKELESNMYFDKLTESAGMGAFVKINDWNYRATILDPGVPSANTIKNVTGCTNLLEVYYAS